MPRVRQFERHAGDRIPDWEDDSWGGVVVQDGHLTQKSTIACDTDRDEIPDCQDEDDDNDGINEL